MNGTTSYEPGATLLQRLERRTVQGGWDARSLLTIYTEQCLSQPAVAAAYDPYRQIG